LIFIAGISYSRLFFICFVSFFYFVFLYFIGYD